MHIIGTSTVSRERIRYYIEKVDVDRNGQLDYKEFYEFIVRGYARELLMMNISREIIYSNASIQLPIDVD